MGDVEYESFGTERTFIKRMLFVTEEINGGRSIHERLDATSRWTVCTDTIFDGIKRPDGLLLFGKNTV